MLMDMAFSRVEFGIVTRSRPGRMGAGSAVAAAAYNLCGRLSHGDRTYDFLQKRNEYGGGAVLLPDGAPVALRDPGALWRAVEAAERRADAQSARQVLLSVPREVPADLRLDFARAVCAPWVADGAAAQIDVHCPRAADGAPQPHAHILLSLRRLGPDGFATKKERVWNKQFREDGGRAERGRIERRANQWLAAHGITVHIDLRSLATRGDDRPPEPTAPHADWQRWKRQGTDPVAAPPAVAAVLAHRRLRHALAAAEVAATAAQVEAHAIQALAACRAAWLAETAARHPPDPRAAIRAQERTKRDAVYRLTRPGLMRQVMLGGVAGGAAADRITARADALARQWTTPLREGLDPWIRRRAAEGHPAAVAVADARKAAAGRNPGAAAAQRAREARATLVAAPRGAAGVGDAAERTLARAMERRAVAETAASEAAAAARAYALVHGILGGWLVLGWQRAAEFRRLNSEAEALRRRANYAARDHAEETAAVERARRIAAPIAQAARMTWIDGPGAAAAAVLRDAEMEAKARARRPVATPVPTAPRASVAVRADPPRTAAVRALAAAERTLADQPHALAAVRTATAAAIAGAPDVVAAAAAGDICAALATGASWAARREEERRHRERVARKKAEELRMAPVPAPRR
jgi:hypothetical protein